MRLLAGKKLAEKILQGLKKQIQKRRLRLRLAVILIGDSLVSKIFIREKKKACQKIGVDFKFFKCPENTSRDIILEEIKKIVADKNNSGIVIQLPLPASPAGGPGKFHTEEFLNLIPEGKDVDVLSEKSFRNFANGELEILPPTVGAVATLLKKYGIRIKNKNIVVVGKGQLVGKPLAAWLKLQKAQFSILDKNTKNICSYTQKADILISGVGSPNLIKGDMVKKGVIAIDVGSSVKNGRAVGDIDFKSVSKKASYITPVPGGVGPLTVACLLDNLVKLNK